MPDCTATATLPACWDMRRSVPTARRSCAWPASVVPRGSTSSSRSHGRPSRTMCTRCYLPAAARPNSTAPRSGNSSSKAPTSSGCARSTNADQDAVWDIAGREILPPSIDAGAIQFLDGRIRFGQLSRVLTDPYAAIDPIQSEAAIRASISKILPKVGELKGIWRNCLVAFSSDNLPLVGAVNGYENLHLFSGFTSPTVYVPALSKRFASHLTGKTDTIIPLLSPQRFL